MAVIVIAIFGVLALELVNSAIERVVDLTTSEIKPLAKQAKDISSSGSTSIRHNVRNYWDLLSLDQLITLMKSLPFGRLFCFKSWS